MHEASLVQGILNLALDSFANYNSQNSQKPAKAINRITCEYGLLSCFEPQTLKACFELFAEGTVAEKAQLALVAAPLQCSCKSCGHEFEILKKFFVCPKCGNDRITVNGGNSLVLKAINVESGEDVND